MLKINDKAPEFSLSDQDGKIHNLKMYKGKKVLLYFYPKDSTPGCTTEACNFRDMNQNNDLEKLGLVVLGVSADSIASHKKFAEKYNLNFPLLSDESKEMIKNYEAWGKKKFMGRIYDGIFRKSFLINEDGKIEKIYEDVSAAKHADEVMGDVKK